jgi:hypothetical protein
MITEGVAVEESKEDTGISPITLSIVLTAVSSEVEEESELVSLDPADRLLPTRTGVIVVVVLDEGMSSL